MIGQTISHYKILEKLGEGGMGVVYKAQDLKLDRLVALKFLPTHLAANEENKKRFVHEAKAASVLDHPNICTFHELGETEQGQIFIAMAYYQGQTVKEKLKDRPLPLQDAICIAISIAQGLAKAHEKGITHRDIKSDNIILTEDSGVKIMDFGLASITGASILTKTGVTVGTVPYMSPEQARGETVDHRSDIWSLGAVIYEMISGQLPFKSQYNEAIVYSILNENPPPLTSLRTDVPMELERITKKCLEKDPSDRYQHVDEIIVDLRRVQAELGGQMLYQRASRPATLQRRAWYLIGGAAIIVAIFLSFFLPRLTQRNQAIHSHTVGTRSSPNWQNSIAVLPFKNISSDEEQEYFCDGMTEQLITNLTSLPNVKVIARTSVMQFKNTEKTIQQIANELGVAHILEGSVRKSGSTIRVTAQLIKANDGFHLWAKDYDRQLKDIFAVQDEVSNAIVGALRVDLTGPQKQSVTKHYTENVEAYNLYLQGRYFWDKQTPTDAGQAVELYEAAIDADPNFAVAYSALAECYVAGPIRLLNAEEKAKGFALKAIQLDSTLIEAHAVLAQICLFHDWDLQSADAEFRWVLQSNPNDVNSLRRYAFALVAMGKPDEAIRTAEDARQLDPSSVITNLTVAQVLFYTHRYSEAVVQSQRVLRIDSTNSIVRTLLAGSYWRIGKSKDALQAIKSSDPFDFFLYSDRGEDARKTLEESIRQVKPDGFTLVSFASRYALLGLNKQALDYLEKAYLDRSPWLIAVRMIPEFDGLQGEPRFRSLLKKMGLER